MKNAIGIVLSLSLLFILPSPVFSQEKPGSQIDVLKERIDQIQQQNEELIRKIQQENAARIKELQQRIEELEEKRYTKEPEIKEDDLDRKIKTIVDESIESKTPEWIKIGFSEDFPSYYRSRARFIKNGTFLGVTDSTDEIFFADSRLAIAPVVNVHDYLSVRTQFDIARNIIWGGTGDELIDDTLYEAPSPRDSFRGALLRDVTNTFSGDFLSPTEDVDLVDIRSLYFVATTPYGEFWVGRQPFDWGMGIVNNAGSMPDQDLGSIVDRFEFDTALLSLIDEKWRRLETNFIIDRLREGRSIGSFDEGDGWDAGFVLLYHGDNYKLGAYLFGIFQNNFALGEGLTADLDPGMNTSLFASYTLSPFRFSFELQHLFGEINDISEPVSTFLGQDSIDITWDNISIAARTEYHPYHSSVKDVSLEFGWAKGDDASTPDKLEGNVLFFNNAFAVDNLLFKHVVPTIYAMEGSVINSFYFRTWSTLRLTDSLYLTPQALLAWVDERSALSTDLFNPLPKVDRFMGTEIEATLSWKLMDNLWFDLIGSFIFSGGGLDDLMAQRAFIEGATDSIDEADPADIPYAVQGRFIITLDDIIGTWTGTSANKQRAFFGY